MTGLLCVCYNKQQFGFSMRIFEEKDYTKWFLDLTDKEQAQVMKRMNNIKKYDHLGDVNSLGDKLYELRWENGWRVYFIKKQNNMILLNGGHKNEQAKDIKKARINMARY